MNLKKAGHINTITLLSGITFLYSFPTPSLGQTPSPTVSISPITPSSNSESNPDNNRSNSLDSSRLNILETKIQTLESKINILESQPTSPNIMPMLLSGLGGAIVGSLLGGLLLQKTSFLKRSPKLQTEKNERIESEKDPTTQYLNATITHLSTTVKNLSQRIKNLESISAANQPSGESPFTSDKLPENGIAPEIDLEGSNIPKLVATYNREPHSLAIKSIEVAETEESLSNRRFNGNQLVVFEHKRNGNYIIVKEKRIEYLIPKPNLAIDENNYSLLEILFECRNYSSSYAYFQLVKPARVLAISGGINWTLEQKGVLEFY